MVGRGLTPLLVEGELGFRETCLRTFEPANARRDAARRAGRGGAERRGGDDASGPQDLSAPRLGLHQLSGNLAGFWAVKVSGNWRVIFRFEGEDAAAVDYLDYH
jgi:proteic killer suppression protein